MEMYGIFGWFAHNNALFELVSYNGPVGCGFLFEDGDVNCPSENKSRC